MRNITATLCLVLIAFIGYAQTDNVGINTTTPNASLDIQAASPNIDKDLETKTGNMVDGQNLFPLSTTIERKIKKKDALA